MLMDLQQLLYFVRSIENGNISQTAHELNISQPAVSKGIKKLEEVLESRLIERYGKGVRATETGKALYKHAKIILNQIDRAVDEVEITKGKSPESLSIGFSPSLVEGVLPHITNEFSKLQPACTLSLHKALYPELLTALKNNELDAVLALDFQSHKESGIELELLGKSSVVFLASKNHPIVSIKKLSLEQMLAARWIILDAKETWVFFNGLFQSINIKPVKPAVITSSLNVIRSTLLSTDLIGFLPRQMVENELEDGSLVQLNAGIPLREMDIVLAHNKELFPSETLKSFLQLTKQVIASHL